MRARPNVRVWQARPVVRTAAGWGARMTRFRNLEARFSETLAAAIPSSLNMTANRRPKDVRIFLEFGKVPNYCGLGPRD
jgi:hypothetical protein